MSAGVLDRVQLGWETGLSRGLCLDAEITFVTNLDNGALPVAKLVT